MGQNNLPSKEAAQSTKTIIKSLPPTRIAPSGAGSEQYRPAQVGGHRHLKWLSSLRLMHVPPF